MFVERGGVRRIIFTATMRHVEDNAYIHRVSGSAPHDLTAGGTRKMTKLIFGISAAMLWLFALILPSYSDGTPGIACFLFGWTMLFDDHTFAFLAWLGNLPFCIAFFMFLLGRKRRVIRLAMLLATISFLLSFGALTISEIANGETGVVTEVDVKSGIYVWMASFLTIAIGSWINYRNSRE